MLNLLKTPRDEKQLKEPKPTEPWDLCSSSTLLQSPPRPDSEARALLQEFNHRSSRVPSPTLGIDHQPLTCQLVLNWLGSRNTNQCLLLPDLALAHQTLLTQLQHNQGRRVIRPAKSTFMTLQGLKAELPPPQDHAQPFPRQTPGHMAQRSKQGLSEVPL